MSGSEIHIGWDIGGTFTDIVAQMGDGALHVRKVASTPDDPDAAVVAGLAELLEVGRLRSWREPGTFRALMSVKSAQITR